MARTDPVSRLVAYRVGAVRQAEAELLARTPDGAAMQRAAAALAVVCAGQLRESTGGVAGRSVVLLVGAGNNGGDALWAGVRLRRRGVAVTALLTSAKTHQEGLAALRAASGTIIDVTRAPAGSAARALATAHLFVDGLAGLGSTPGLREPGAALVAELPAGVPVIAVDLPSGVHPDTGELPVGGISVRADVTVTLGAPTPCLLLPPAAQWAGRIVPVDLGMRGLSAVPDVERLGDAELAALWPAPAPAQDKYRRGVLGVVAGSSGYPGAAVLTVSGALRAGVGMVRYQGPDPVADAVRAAWPEIVAGPGRVQAWVLGPGVDPQAAPDQVRLIGSALESGEPAVLDAGAILAWAAGSSARSHSRLLLTPHAGELAALLALLGEPVQRAQVEARPWHYASLAARRTGATVLLKGAITLIVRPDGAARSQAEATPWLATAGAGDVLAGIAGALLAAGLSPFDAGAVAASVHGRAARRASAGGPIVSADVASAVPAVVADLLRAAAPSLPGHAGGAHRQRVVGASRGPGVKTYDP
jgi:ADP-dependent NAD(P)H-hydrate dehydratase / NAD(P)H-hydrate epimerase